MRDQELIHDSDLVERYVTGRLPAEEQASFEAHFIDCPQCLDRLEAAQALRRGMSALPVREEQPPAKVHFLRSSRAPAFAIAASIILLLALAGGAAFRDAQRTKHALEAERVTAARLQQQLDHAQAALRQEEASRSGLEKELSQSRQPQLQVPVFALIAMRGDDSETLQLPSAPQWILLSFDRESPPRFDRYRLTLLSSTGKQLWEGESKATSRDTLAVGLHSSLVPPGSYVFQVQGIGKSGTHVLVARHRVHVVTESPNSPRR
jgi:hypothetical protein